MKSIASIGIVNPLLVLEETNEVVGGTTRLAIAQDLNIEEVPVVYLKGSFTQEEITEILINSNLYRKKTPLEKAREYRELKKYEIATTKSKKSAKGGKNGEVSTLEPRQKSRFKAAERIGGGATSLDKAEKTLNAADKLEAEGNVEAAAELLRILETKTYNAAYKRALELGAIVGKKARKAKPVDGKAVAGPAKPAGVIEAAEIAPKVIAEKPGEELIVDFAAPPLPKEEDPVEVPDAPKVVGSALDAVNAHIAAVKFFLLDIQFRGVPEDMKADLGLAIGEINHLAAAAGVPVKVI